MPPRHAKMKVIDEVTYKRLDAPEEKSKPSRKAKKWAKKNPWFLKEGCEEMTERAYCLHSNAIHARGFKADSDDYYNYIDAGMRAAFPNYAWTNEEPDTRLEDNNGTS